jgi:hypothetical protein
MKKRLGTFLILIFAVTTLPVGSQQETKSRQVTAFDALDQIQTLIQVDEIEKRPATDTLWVVKQLTMLNNLQISNYELKQEPVNPNVPIALGLQQSEDAFNSLRESVCKQRPYLKIVDLDGRTKSCH